MVWKMFPGQELEGGFRPDVEVVCIGSLASEGSCTSERIIVSYRRERASVMSLHLHNESVSFR
jgi:hypothetical protein